jgi:DNA-binding MarR family transcriptional regulator
MDNTYSTFNEILVGLFHEIMGIEEEAVITEEFKDISNNDMHIIEAIGKNDAKNMSSVAKAMGVTVGTLTIAINNLVKKGYVVRHRSDRDRRVVLVSLTEKGERAYDHHKQFHDDMVRATVEGLNEEDKDSLVRGLTNLSNFFKGYIKQVP